jgi:alpha-N-acetylglucosaminidase
MPLAFTGQEKAWQNTFVKRYNISQQGMDKFFAGAAFLAWGRMGNLRGSWVKGPLPQAFIDDQYALQRRILARMTEFGMIPALPAFAGHVPEELTARYPHAKFTRSPNWGHFSDEFCCVYMLESTDPLYLEIGQAFIEEQKALYQDVTSSSLYQCDTYNEMDPDFTDPERLRAASGAVIKSMAAADPDAVWLMQGWLFVDAPAYWTKPRVQAYLDGVPDNKMIILDLYSEVRPVWQQMDNYFGKQWIYCVLHNFGGNTGMRGDLPTLAAAPVAARDASNGTFAGIGLTMEGIFQNYVVYDLSLQMAWQHTPVDTVRWIEQFADQRYNIASTYNDLAIGQEETSAAHTAWGFLLRSVYNRTLAYGGVTKNIVSLIPHWRLDRDGFMPTVISYDRRDVVEAWRHLLRAGGALSHVDTFRHDLVDVTRQFLSDQLLAEYQQLRDMFTHKSVQADKLCALTQRMLQLMGQLDEILGTNEDFLLGRWIADARAMGAVDKHPADLEDYYEYEARNQVTRWGDNNSESIHDYAAKEWSGLIADYYVPRWRIWLTEVCQAYTQHREMNEVVVNKARVSFELKWQLSHEHYPTQPRGDPLAVSRRLFAEYVEGGEPWEALTSAAMLDRV